MSLPPTRLEAVVLLRQALRELLPQLSGRAREQAAAALQATRHVQAPLGPAVVAPALFGWAIRPAGKPGAPWGLERDAAHAQWCMAARDDAGQPHFEVVALAALPGGQLPAPAPRLCHDAPATSPVRPEADRPPSAP